jgi:8-oxo-dGTP diphosphatase
VERDGNGWVECDQGHRHWGRHGAAGLLVHSVDDDDVLRLLLQHRADWCHHGGTWGLPGGARDSHETVEQAALREASEETALDVTQVRTRHTFVDDHGGWSYTTVYGDALTQLDTVPNDESAALEWVPVDRVDALPLHPGFGHTWPRVRLSPLAVVVDLANVMGSRPDGWWKDRLGAAERWGAELGPVRAMTVPVGDQVGVVTSVHVVVEGQARGASLTAPVTTVRAPGSGDDAVVETVVGLTTAGTDVVVVTSDRELRRRVADAGIGRVTVTGPSWLTDLLT